MGVGMAVGMEWDRVGVLNLWWCLVNRCMVVGKGAAEGTKEGEKGRRGRWVDVIREE